MSLKENFDTLVLSGGGAKGFSMLGALQCLIDNKMLNLTNISIFSGSSVGVIIIYFLIIGYTPVEIIVYLCSKNVMESLNINNFSELLNGVYNYDIITEHCKNMTLDKIGYIPTLGDIKEKFGKTFYITTYNLTLFKKEYLSYKTHPDLSCLNALRMTSNLPFIFGEYIYKNCEYIDGGIVDNFPISIIDKISSENEQEHKILGVFMSDKRKDSLNNDNKDEMSGNTIINKILKYVDKAYNILMVPISEREKEKFKNNKNTSILSLFVSIKAYKFSLSHSEKLELFSEGYTIANKNLTNL